jgi:hypothetical protein
LTQSAKAIGRTTSEEALASLGNGIHYLIQQLDLGNEIIGDVGKVHHREVTVPEYLFPIRQASKAKAGALSLSLCAPEWLNGRQRFTKLHKA